MKLTRGIRIGAAIAGLATFAVFGAVGFAFVSIRSHPEAQGASAAAWVVVGLTVILFSLLAALAGGAFVALMAWALRRIRGPSPE